MTSTEHTLSMLYGAQHNQQLQLPSSQTETPQSIAVAHTQPIQKSNLHAFWSLPQKPQQATSSVSNHHTTTTPTHCEDCNASLNDLEDSGAMDVDMMAMDVDERDFGCISCGKQVCHSCAVSNLGAERKCLGCTKPRGISRSIFG